MTSRLGTHRASTLWLTAGMVFIVGLVAMGRGLTFDETVWLVFARRILSGDLPYVDLYDNKGPLVYAVFTILDALPGGFEPARHVAFGLMAGANFVAGRSLAHQSGSSDAAASIRGIGGAAMIVILSSFALTTELFSVTLLTAGLVLSSGRPTLGLLLMVSAAGFDPRSILFLAPYLMKLSTEQRRRPATLAILAGSVAAVLLVLAVPSLRYSIVELSTGTRFLDSWVPADQILLAAACLLPIVALAIYGRVGRPDGPTVVIGLVAAAIGAGSLFPFGHYWTYLPLLVFTLPLRRDDAVGMGLALFPLLLPLLVINQVDVDRDIAETESVASFATSVAQLIDRDDSVLVWSSLPQTSLPYARQTMLPAASVNYLGWTSGRYESNIVEFGRLANDADILVVEGPLDASIPIEYRPSAQLLVEELAGRGCDPRASRPFVCDRPPTHP